MTVYKCSLKLSCSSIEQIFVCSILGKKRTFYRTFAIVLLNTVLIQNSRRLNNQQNLFEFFFRQKGRVLFNDTLNTFYLHLFGVRHMVKDHSNSERGNPLSPHGLLFPISRQDKTYNVLCYTSRGALAGTRNSSMVFPSEINYNRGGS